MKLARIVFPFVVLLAMPIVQASAGEMAKVRVEKPFEPFAEAWTHVSPTSAIVYWQTGNDARRVETAGQGYVEYGPTADYGRKTETFSLPPVCEEVPDKVRVFPKPSWSQFHRLAGLETGKAFHWRMVYIAPDGTVTKGEDKVLTPKAVARAIALPGALEGPPYVLDAAITLTRARPAKSVRSTAAPAASVPPCGCAGGHMISTSTTTPSSPAPASPTASTATPGAFGRLAATPASRDKGRCVSPRNDYGTLASGKSDCPVCRLH